MVDGGRESNWQSDGDRSGEKKMVDWDLVDNLIDIFISNLTSYKSWIDATINDNERDKKEKVERI